MIFVALCLGLSGHVFLCVALPLVGFLGSRISFRGYTPPLCSKLDNCLVYTPLWFTAIQWMKFHFLDARNLGRYLMGSNFVRGKMCKFYTIEPLCTSFVTH